MTPIRIKGLAERYECFLDNKQQLHIFNEKQQELGSKHFYNSEQTSYCLYCEDGKRRSFYSLRLLYAYTNNISVLDIPKGCIYRTRYGLEYYNKRNIIKRPLKEREIGNDKIEYMEKLDKHWSMIKEAITSQNLTNIANVLMSFKTEVLRRCKYSIPAAKEVLEDCFFDAVEYYIKRLVSPKYKMNICLPNDALTSYTIKRYKTYYKPKNKLEVRLNEKIKYEQKE